MLTGSAVTGDIGYWSGVFLLFSAGTLVFASTSVHGHGEEEIGAWEVAANVLGMGIPLVLGGLGHRH
jgi:hypothetical protein